MMKSITLNDIDEYVNKRYKNVFSKLAKRKENLKPYERLVSMPREYITNKKKVVFL